MAPSEAWKYVNSTQNPGDVGTRETACKNPESIKLWSEGPKFLLQENVSVFPESVPVVRRTLYNESSDFDENGLDKIFKSAGSFYSLKKRLAILTVFTEYFTAKSEIIKFIKPTLNAEYRDQAFIKAVKYVQSQSFGAAIDVLSHVSPDD